MATPYSKAVQDLLNLDEAPDLFGMSHNVSLVLYNSLPVIEGARPVNPNTIYVGGMHAKAPSPLTGKLQKFVEEAKDGVIYVSFGSVSLVGIFCYSKLLLIMSILGAEFNIHPG